MNTDTRNIRLVIKTPVAISFTISLDVPISVCGKSLEMSGREPGILPQVNGSDIWQKGYRSGLLDRMGEGALMLGTTSRQSSGYDFATLGDKVSE
jgi:hypothetical protein